MHQHVNGDPGRTAMFDDGERLVVGDLDNSRAWLQADNPFENVP